MSVFILKRTNFKRHILNRHVLINCHHYEPVQTVHRDRTGFWEWFLGHCIAPPHQWWWTSYHSPSIEQCYTFVILLQGGLCINIKQFYTAMEIIDICCTSIENNQLFISYTYNNALKDVNCLFIYKSRSMWHYKQH